MSWQWQTIENDSSYSITSHCPLCPGPKTHIITASHRLGADTGQTFSQSASDCIQTNTDLLQTVGRTSVESLDDLAKTKCIQMVKRPLTDTYRYCTDTILTRCSLCGLLKSSKDNFAPPDLWRPRKVCSIVSEDLGPTSNRPTTDQTQTCQFAPFLKSLQVCEQWDHTITCYLHDVTAYYCLDPRTNHSHICSKPCTLYLSRD